jgi:hypothetical protein
MLPAPFYTRLRLGEDRYGERRSRGLAARLAEAAKPERFNKTAIVFLGVSLGVQTVQAYGVAYLFHRGLVPPTAR